MAVYYAIGQALVSHDELRVRAASGDLPTFFKQARAGASKARIDFLHGTATGGALRGMRAPRSRAPIKPVPIGLGLPLTVQIRHVYTGDQAHGFWGDKDMLVASAMKSIATYDGAPRAVNFLVQKAKQNRNFRAVDATDKGTPLICYSPSLAQSSSVVTVEVVFDSFPTEAFAAVAQAFSAAAGLPVFAPAGGYLAAAGIVTKLAGNIGKTLSNGTPALKRTEEITFVTPGSNTAEAGFCLLIADSVRTSVLNDYTLSDVGALVRKDDSKTLYDGGETYVVISLDGRENDDFKSFAPTAASAALLDRFYNIGDGASQPLGQLQAALTLYNDMTYRDKALNAAAKLAKVADRTSRAYLDLKAQYDGYVGNITHEVLKPTGA
jgi:hypothetical protein